MTIDPSSDPSRCWSTMPVECFPRGPGVRGVCGRQAGVVNYTKTAALELAPHGIRVNALAPDFTLTEGLTAMSTPQSLTRAARMVPMARAGQVDEMAAAAVFLASDMSSYVTGQTSTWTAVRPLRLVGTRTPRPASTRWVRPEAANTARANSRQAPARREAYSRQLHGFEPQVDVPTLHRTYFELRFAPEWTAVGLACSLHVSRN
jgi:hypothetical protein